MRFRLGWLAMFFVGCLASAAPVCENPVAKPTNNLGMGAAIALLLPSHMPEFELSTGAVGPIVVIPIGNLALVNSFVYGPAGDVSAYFLESSLRIPLPTPFLPWYLLVGAQALHYSAPVRSHNYIGVHFGPAMVFSISKTLDLQMAMKIYFQSDMMTGFSGNLIFRL